VPHSDLYHFNDMADTNPTQTWINIFYPAQVCLDSHGRIYIPDTYNASIVRIDRIYVADTIIPASFAWMTSLARVDGVPSRPEVPPRRTIRQVGTSHTGQRDNAGQYSGASNDSPGREQLRNCSRGWCVEDMRSSACLAGLFVNTFSSGCSYLSLEFMVRHVLNTPFGGCSTAS